MRRPSLVLVHSPVLGPTSVQSTARALSGLGWICVTPTLTDATTVAEHVEAAAAGVPEAAVLIAHSGAGPLVPAIAARVSGRVRGAVFVDATIPVVEGGTALAEPAMLDFLADRTVDGSVLPWSEWWGDAVFGALVPDPALAEALRTEMRALPIEFFRSKVPVPPAWPTHPCAYLQLSAAYDADAAEARGRGWTFARRDGGHLDPATRPEPTAVALDRLLEQML